MENAQKYYGDENVLNTLTLKTLQSKSAVITACRGLGINDDTAHMLAGLIPIERGTNWSLTECFEGNEEKGRDPQTAFINAVRKHDMGSLKKTMLDLEGIICGRGIHASSVYLYNDGYIKQNSLMRAPNGTPITAFNMSDSDYMGGLKMDLLTIKALDKMQTAMQILIDEGLIEDQGSLKDTYNRYFSTPTLDYTDEEMWDMLARNEIIDLFQFDTPQGKQAAQKIKPHSLLEMASANSLMRLMPAEGDEAPIDVYVRYKNNIELWYQEMTEHGLNAEEQEIMKKHLDSVYGVASAQEEVMLLAMDKDIAGFTMEEANKLRKGIAKKKPKILKEIKELFFKKCEEQGTSKALASYVWDVQFKRQFSYSFSTCHTLPYSAIGLQEMNIVKQYGSIYWNTACLTVNAGADTDNENNDVTDYGKIGAAIGVIKGQGQTIALPSINRARFDFRPEAQRNEIVYALKALRGVRDEEAACIVAHQPYASFDDFVEKTKATVKASAVMALIKAGAFDELEGENRRLLMERFLMMQGAGLKKLTMRNIKELEQVGAIGPDEYVLERNVYNYVQYVKARKPALTEGKKNWYYVKGTRDDETFFNEYVREVLKEGKDYEVYENGYVIAKGTALDRAQKKLTAKLKEEVLDNPKKLRLLNRARVQALMDEKCPGSLSAWEFQSMTSYHGPHELINVDEDKYGIENFFELPTTPRKKQVVHGNRSYAVKDKCNIAGTIIDKNANKHTVTLLTTHGVVTVKFIRDDFSLYNQQISRAGADGKKVVLEKPWFSRGNKVLVRGFREDDRFSARPEKNPHIPSVKLIENIDEDGTLALKLGRVRV